MKLEITPLSHFLHSLNRSMQQLHSSYKLCPDGLKLKILGTAGIQSVYWARASTDNPELRFENNSRCCSWPYTPQLCSSYSWESRHPPTSKRPVQVSPILFSKTWSKSQAGRKKANRPGRLSSLSLQRTVGCCFRSPSYKLLSLTEESARAPTASCTASPCRRQRGKGSQVESSLLGL